MKNKKKKEKLFEEAKRLGILLGDYDNALKIIETFLKANKKDYDFIYLRGLILDLKANEMELLIHPLEKEASELFEKSNIYLIELLKQSPKDIAVILDIASNASELGKYKLSLKYYDLALRHLKKGTYTYSFSEEVQEAVSGKIELLEKTTDQQALNKFKKDIKKWFPENFS